MKSYLLKADLSMKLSHLAFYEHCSEKKILYRGKLRFSEQQYSSAILEKVSHETMRIIITIFKESLIVTWISFHKVISAYYFQNKDLK